MRRSFDTVSATMLAALLIFAALLGSVAMPIDFRAFYCAGFIAGQHEDPYLTEPLHRCERALPNDPFKPYSATVAVPAPLPGYAVALFVPFSRLRFEPATRIWTMLLFAAIAIVIAALVALTGLPIAVVSPILLLSLWASSVTTGETVPVCVAAIALGALLAQKGKWVGAALAATASLIEPHLGLPVVLALALWAPAARLPLLGALVALGSLSLATLGLHTNVEYFTHVLPAQALSELGSDTQLSLSVILNGIGLAPKASIGIGVISYLISLVLGVAISKVLAQRLNSNAFLVATPVAMSLVGGTYIHITQMAAALPLALLLAVHAPRFRPLFAATALLLAIPWLVVGNRHLGTAAALVVFYLAWEYCGRNVVSALASATCAAVFLLTLNLWMPPPHAHARVDAGYSLTIDTRYAEASWARYDEQILSTGAAERWLGRAPTWLALLFLGGGAVALASPQRAQSYAILVGNKWNSGSDTPRLLEE
jgi:hypothetical protein